MAHSWTESSLRNSGSSGPRVGRTARSVALKFPPEKFFGNQIALERFRREAKAASALNHAHICAIHDIDEHEGQLFISMELLEGQALKHCIARKPFKTQDLLELALGTRP